MKDEARDSHPTVADIKQRAAENERLRHQLMKWRAFARAAWELIDEIARNGNL